MARRKNALGDIATMPVALAEDRPKGDQVREILENLVEDLDAGSFLPSERALAERYGIARMTVRQEIDRLVADGVVARRPGGGTLVAGERPAPMTIASSFSKDMRARGLEPGATVLEHTVAPAGQRIADKLEVPVGSPTLRLVRLRTADGAPVALERTVLPLTRFPDLDAVDFAKASLYDELERRWGVRPGVVSAVVVAALPEAGDAALLDMPATAPCLVITSAPRSRADEVIESGRSIYRGDRYDLAIGYRAG